MTMTSLTLVWMGSLATLASMVLVINIDRPTRVLVSFAASLIWGLFGIASFDVYVDDSATVAEPMLPMAYLGIGFSVIVGMFALYHLAKLLGSEAGATEADGLID